MPAADHKHEVKALVTEVLFYPDGLDDEECDRLGVSVTWRGHNLYAVKRRSQVWNGSEWEYEPQPSSRDDGFIARTRFDYVRACQIATELVEADDAPH